MEVAAEQKLVEKHKQYMELEIRKFRRKRLLQYHQLEQDLLIEVFYNIYLSILEKILASMS